MTFLGNVESNELRFFIHAAVQGLLPSTAILPPIKQLQIEMNAGSERDSVKYRTLPQLSSSWIDTVESVITEMQSKDFSSVSWERQLGFLHLLEQMIRVVGFTATPYVSLVYKIVVNLLEMTTIVSGEGQTSEPLLQDPIDENDIEDEDGDEMHQETTNESKKESKRSELRSRNQASKVRSLSLLRLAGSSPIQLLLILILLQFQKLRIDNNLILFYTLQSYLSNTMALLTSMCFRTPSYAL